MAGLFDERGSLIADAAIGAAAGLAATAAVAAIMQLGPRLGFDPAGKGAGGEPQVGSPEAASESMDILSRAVTGHEVPEEEQMAATSAFQFVFGAGLGAAYGIAARLFPVVTAGRGTLFGGAIFALFDEMLVPAVGLTGKPQDSGSGAHAGALGIHLVFGSVVETVRRLLRRR